MMSALETEKPSQWGAPNDQESSDLSFNKPVARSSIEYFEADEHSASAKARPVSSNGRAQSTPVSLPRPLSPHDSLSAYTFRQPSHLPTPQSPKNKGNGPSTPESPLVNSRHTFHWSEEPRPASSMNTHHVVTPDSSPFFSRVAPATPSRSSTSFPDSVNNVSVSSVGLGSPKMSLAPPHQITPPASSSKTTSTRSRLSSPFMDKLSFSEKQAGEKIPSRLPLQTLTMPTRINDVFTGGGSAPAPAPPMVFSTPPLSPPFVPVPTSNTNTSGDGGEIEKIRMQTLEQHREILEEAESRRPDYFKRVKRNRHDPDHSPPVSNGTDVRVDDRVGIASSPVKGRRLKLFQETSEESFEESLMAGGYGRYRTFDWSPEQPMQGPEVLASVDRPPSTDANPISLKEKRKRKRFEAFRDSAKSPSITKLYPVEIDGKGRVLLDAPLDDQVLRLDGPTSQKKKTTRRKKKSSVQELILNGKGPPFSSLQGDTVTRPNWPDAEFPWCLRLEERAELTRKQDEEKLRWIEKFLDRDTDEEDEEEEATVTSHQWGETPPSGSMRKGRGKMVPFRGERASDLARTSPPPPAELIDPADARATLRSKRSVLASLHRHRGRKGDNDDEIVCVCQGRNDDKLELVQCDDCLRWYHIRCIGIKSISELGKEEDPWYCPRCQKHTPSPPPSLAHREPTLVPTYSEPSSTSRTPYDPPFFQAAYQDSPMFPWALKPPQTPPRGPPGGGVHPSFRPGPSTPQYRDSARDVKMYTTPGPSTDESSFDPNMMTPSRGYSNYHGGKFSGGPFVTPKSSGSWFWNARGPPPPPPAFQTPLRSEREGSRYERGWTGFENTPRNHLPQVPELPRTPVPKRIWESPPGGSRLVAPLPVSPLAFSERKPPPASGGPMGGGAGGERGSM